MVTPLRITTPLWDALACSIPEEGVTVMELHSGDIQVSWLDRSIVIHPETRGYTIYDPATLAKSPWYSEEVMVTELVRKINVDLARQRSLLRA